MSCTTASKNIFIGVRNLGRYLLQCSGIWICILREMVNIKHARVRVYNVITMKNLGVILTVKWVVHSSSNSRIHIIFQREYVAYSVVCDGATSKHGLTYYHHHCSVHVLHRTTRKARTYIQNNWMSESATREIHQRLSSFFFFFFSFSRCCFS